MNYCEKQLEQEITLHDYCFDLATTAKLSEVSAYACAREVVEVYAEAYTGNIKQDAATARKLIAEFTKYLDHINRNPSS